MSSAAQTKILVGLSILTVIVIGMVVYLLTFSQRPVKHQPQLSLPQPSITEAFTNPFSEESTYQSPFEEEYQNPFEESTPVEESQPYENPFETLR